MGVDSNGQKDGTWTYCQENGAKDRDEVYDKGERLGDFANEAEEAEPEKVEEEIEKPKPFNFKRLINIKMDGHYLKTLNSKPYTGRDQIL